MAKVRGRDTQPEITVRKMAHAAGFRFRLHRRDLPGSPDLVFPGRAAVIFVHGCFWHGHAGCRAATVPKTRTEYWLGKIQTNRLRDARDARRLRREGWRVLTVWECETKLSPNLAARIARFLDARDRRRPRSR